jgi:catechol 2,3-dioxygenase-like lactoylglutathione lyase family enzyme
MTITGLNHVSVTTVDIDRSLAFYHELLGLPLRGRGEIKAAHLDAILGLGPVRLRWAELHLGPGQILELFQYLTPTGTPIHQTTADPGSVHIALNVQDIDATYHRLQTAAVTCRSAPITIPTGDWAGTRCLYALDPDGVTIELIQQPS